MDTKINPQLAKEKILYHQQLQSYETKPAPFDVTITWIKIAQELNLQVLVTKKNLPSSLPQNFIPPWHTDELQFSASDPRKNWGLWNYDVVELFWSTDARHKTYTEWQVSPLGQGLELQIIKPRSIYFTPLTTSLKFAVNCKEHSWQTIFTLSQATAAKTPIFWGAYACLHDGQGHTWHFTHEIDPEGIPNFHQPEKFKTLDF